MKLVASTLDVLDDLQWLQRLATMMARDADEAADLVQDTLVDACRAPPSETDEPLRPWLTKVLRNRFFMRRRGQIRRERREQHAASVSPERRAPDLEHERIEVLHILLAELRQLPRSDQSIIVRRFFEDQSAAEIGRDLGIPSATIRSRIHRSLQRLRRSLDRTYGSRTAWCAAVLAMPGEGLAPPISNAGRHSTMSITARAIVLISTGTLGVAGWFAISPADGSPTEVASADEQHSDDVAAPEVDPPARSDADAEADADVEAGSSGSRAQWERRRQDIRRVLPDAPVDAAEDAEPPAQAQRERAEYLAFREMVDACTEDLGTGATGALTLSIHEIGAPDVGTIYESVEVVHSNLDDPDVIECLTQSMYAHVGEPPAEAFERIRMRTMHMGEPVEPSEREAQQIGFIIGAHIGEVRFCQSKAEGEVEGEVSIELTIGESGLAESAVPGFSDLPAPVVECITSATRRWKFPGALVGKAWDQQFMLPIRGQRPGPVEPSP
jgi:RNA polymerase sigma factor (sigma-70 family)